MQDKWYADKRDIVKWGTLVHVARKHQATKILQVACYRQPETGVASLTSEQGNEPPQPVSLPQEVYRYFRDVRDIERLQNRTDLTIEVFNKEFCHPREAYFESVAEQVKRKRRNRLVVFLDPDTGIAPERATLAHVTDSEIRQIYGAMRKGDLLVFYQHARRRKEWKREAMSELARALAVPQKRIVTFTCPEIAPDVALFLLQKQA